MKLTMSHVIKGLLGLGICSVIMLLSTEPAQAVLEGSNRNRIEFLDYSETLIKETLYAKTGKSTFNRDKKKYVRGIKRHNEPKVYEPDVYSWELAMAEHRKKVNALAQASAASSSNVSPIPMIQDNILPTDPTSKVVEKKGKKNKKGRKARKNKSKNNIEETQVNNNYQSAAVFSPTVVAPAPASIYSSPSTSTSVPALQPAMQPKYYPQGKTGDSCDTSF